jgi:hypothetical protein
MIRKENMKPKEHPEYVTMLRNAIAQALQTPGLMFMVWFDGNVMWVSHSEIPVRMPNVMLVCRVQQLDDGTVEITQHGGQKQIVRSTTTDHEQRMLQEHERRLQGNRP